MRLRIPVLAFLVTAGGAYLAVSHDTAPADVRIVQPPPTASASPQQPATGATSEAGTGSGSLAVGFTLFEGRLYLVSTSDKSAAARTGQLAAPTFVCDKKPAATKGAGLGFEAWLLRNNGGSGAVPQFDGADGSLLTAPHTGTPLHCALREGPEQ